MPAGAEVELLRDLQESSLNPHQKGCDMDPEQLLEGLPAMGERKLAEDQRDAEDDSASIGSDACVSPAPVDEEESQTKTVVVFDWDDTLLASSFLFDQGYRLDTEVECERTKAQLKQLENGVADMITTALKHADAVFVITNAQTGWVELSAQRFLPGLVPLLQRLQVISARSTFEDLFPNSPLKWKYFAFKQSVDCLTNFKGKKHIISLGDSLCEREAVRAATRGLPNTHTKSVKFAERPSMEQLSKQIEVVSQSFDYIFRHEGDLDLMLTISVL